MRLFFKPSTSQYILMVILISMMSLMGCNESSDSSGQNQYSENTTGTTDTQDTDTDNNAGSQIVINEIVAAGVDGASDWIELYVVSGSVSLGDYTLIDDKEGREPATLPDITLSAGQFLVIYAANEAPEDGSYYVPFKLGSDDSVTLLLNSQVIDQLDWEEGQAPEGYSFGRLPDGTGSATTLTPTPDSANSAASGDVTAPIDDVSSLFPHDRVIDVYLELSETDKQDMFANPLAEEEKPGSITHDGIKLSNVSIRTKGNSSLRSVAQMGSQRFSFKVDMNEYVDGQTLNGLKKLNLNNGFKDPSFMREYLGYELMRYLNIPTPRCAFVNLYINNQLWGLYLAVEHVDSKFIKDNYFDNDGDLYKPDGVGSDLKWISDNMADYSGVELKTNEDTSDNSAFLAMVNELNNGTSPDLVLNADEILRYLAVSTLLSNLDSYQGSLAHNYYLYEDNGIFDVIPWDLNESFGTFNAGCTQDSILALMIDEPTSTALSDRPLINKLFQNQEHLNAYHDYLTALIQGPFASATMEQTIATTANMIRAYVQADPTKFFTDADFETSLTDDVGQVFGLQSFIDARIANILNQLSGISAAKGDGSGNCPNAGIPGNGPGGPGNGQPIDGQPITGPPVNGQPGTDVPQFPGTTVDPGLAE